MKKDDRYDVSDLAETQFEPGSNEQVLRNRLDIKSPKEMDDTETRALEKAMVGLVGKYDEQAWTPTNMRGRMKKGRIQFSSTHSERKERPQQARANHGGRSVLR